MRYFRFTAALGVLIGVGAASSASAYVDFQINAAGSSVTITDQSGGGHVCTFTRCGIEASIASGLPTSFTLDHGGSTSFDFLTFTADGTTNWMGRNFGIAATLSFDTPVEATTTSSGHGTGFFISGFITGGSLSWDDVPVTVALSDGTEVTVNFLGGVSILPLTTALTTGASVAVSPIPLPATLPLLLVAAGGLAVALRRRGDTPPTVA